MGRGWEALRAVRVLRASVAVCLFAVMGCAESSPSGGPSLLETRVVRTIELPSSAGYANIVDADWLGDTALLLLDDGGQRLHAIGWTKDRIALLAAKGRGPGELQGATSVLSLAPQGFVVVDPGARQWSLWTNDGRILGTRHLSATWGAWIVGTTIVVKSQDPQTARLTFRAMDVQSARAETVVASIDVLVAADLPCLYCPTAVSPSGVIAAATRDSAYLIRRYRADGTEQEPIRRSEIPPVPLSAAELDSVDRAWDGAIETYIAATRVVRPGDIERIKRARDAATVKKRFLPNGLRFDDQDRLWVQRHVTEHEAATVDVYDSDGRMLGILTLEPGELLVRVAHGRLLTLLEREDGSARIRELQMLSAPFAEP